MFLQVLEGKDPKLLKLKKTIFRTIIRKEERTVNLKTIHNKAISRRNSKSCVLRGIFLFLNNNFSFFR